MDVINKLLKYYQVYYDGWELTEFCTVTAVKKRLSAPVDNVYLTNPNVDGASFRSSRLGQLSLDIEITIIGDVLYNLDQLNLILHSRTEKKLIISDQPDRYLMCKLVGEITPTSRKSFSTFTLKMASSNYYWGSTAGKVTQTFGTDGRAVLDNKGTAPTPVGFEIDFSSDCGFIGVVAPDRFITLGNATEVDKVEVPPTETALNEEMDDLTTWTRVSSLTPFIHPDEVSSSVDVSLAPATDEWGMIANSAWPTNDGKWSGTAIRKDFQVGATGKSQASDFSLKSRIDLENLSGTTKNFIHLRYYLLDSNGSPLIQVRITDSYRDKNQLDLEFYLINPETKMTRKKVKRTIGRVRGFLSIDKRGTEVVFTVNSESSTTTVQSLKKNDIVYLLDSTRTIYDQNGKAKTMSDTIRGVPLKVTKDLNDTKGTANAGRVMVSNAKHGWAEGYFPPSAFKGGQVATQVKKETVVERLSDSLVAQHQANSILIVMTTFEKPYTKASVNSVVINRLHTESLADIPNSFRPGDKLTIEPNGVVSLNGRFFSGLSDYDSRPIYIDGGKTELAVVKSDWALMPSVKATYESRWL